MGLFSRIPPTVRQAARRASLGARPIQRRMLRPVGRRVAMLPLLGLLFVGWCVCLGWGLAQALEAPKDPLAAPVAIAAAPMGTVDVIPEKYQVGQEIYLKTCATCHIGLPPAVLPSDTWQQLLQDTQHYGTVLPELRDPNLRLIWDYLKFGSRPRLEGEEVPYRIYQSRYFKALHPRVKLKSRVQIGSCVSCHIGAGSYDFRSLSAEWQNAP